VTTTKINTLTPDQKEEEREKIAQEIKKYLAKGGKVTECPPRAFTQVEGPKKRFDGGRNDSLTDPTNRDVGAYRPTKKET
tara:strand:- start:31 stop:270 length:240 start_codon:yes stop_codon:yes gene_type:complete